MTTRTGARQQQDEPAAGPAPQPQSVPAAPSAQTSDASVMSRRSLDIVIHFSRFAVRTRFEPVA